MQRQFQQTIANPCSIAGVGLHTGAAATLTMKPANVGFGIRFQRIDIEGKPEIKADVDYVIDTSRGTTLSHNGANVHTVEHLMAALAGCGIDNVLLELDGPEIPIMDGSAFPFVEAILKAGIVEQDAKKIYYAINENLQYHNAEKGSELLAVPANEYQITTMIDFNTAVLGTQHASMKSIEEFNEHVSKARTFCFLHELQYLVSKNLIKGGDLNNAIVLVDKSISDAELAHLAEVFNKPEIAVEKEGILNNLTLHYSNEPARHKLLDVLGDLALSGYAINAHIIAHRPGHESNVAFAKVIKEYVKKNKSLADIPVYDPTIPPVYDINHIEKTLPHRFPFLLVDKIIDITDEYVVGVKNVTFNEHFFQGHFPQNPVMPGVLQIESMAQVGGLLAMNHLEDPENYDTYFLKIDKVKFKSKVMPGDTLIIKMELLRPIRRGICEMKGTIFVGNKMVTEAELVAQIVPSVKLNNN